MNPTLTDNKELFFTKNYDVITSSTKLSSDNKLLIARILNWQQSDLICTESNVTLANKLGISLACLKRQIMILNKYDWFTSRETSRFNEYGTWCNSKSIVIDEAGLENWLDEAPSTKKAPSTKVVTKQAPAPKQVVVEQAKVQQKDDFIILFIKRKGLQLEDEQRLIRMYNNNEITTFEDVNNEISYIF